MYSNIRSCGSLIFTTTCVTDIRQDVGNRTKRNEFIQTVSRKHFLNKHDIRNIQVKVQDRLVIRHRDDAQSVSLAVAELQQEPFNPVMAFKMQGIKNPLYSTLPEYRQSFRWTCIESMWGVYFALILPTAPMHTDTSSSHASYQTIMAKVTVMLTLSKF